MRKCLSCKKELVLKENEKRAQFLKRKYCDMLCSINDRTRKAQEKRALQAIKDREVLVEAPGLTYTREEILHRARMTAPQIPIAIIAQVIDEISPMVSANIRHSILSPIATNIRNTRAS